MKQGKAARAKRGQPATGKPPHPTTAQPAPAVPSAGRKILVFAVAGLVAAGASVAAWQLANRGAESASGGRQIVIAQLSSQAVEGRRTYDTVCADCHGAHGAGTSKGPPLIHDIYNPGHHGDESFYRAVRSGARQHHWRFGDMPAQPEVSALQIAAILRYVREMQVANGIVARPHTN